MKTISYMAVFLLFIVVIIFGGGHFYDFSNAAINKGSNTHNEIKDSTQISTADLKLSNKKVIEKTPPHLLAGFDWSLPKNTQVTKDSGLLGEGSPDVIKNHFIIVPWDKTNPALGKYDFSDLEAELKSIAPKQALLRLEVNSSCEAPKWALGDLRQSSHKSLIYWDESYQYLMRLYIQSFAKRFASHPQIIGVQLGLADGEFGTAPDSCDNYSNKQGWGEFWMSPSERQEAETQFGFTPKVFEKETIANIDIYADAFGEYKHKLAFTNLGTLFTYGDGAKPYNQSLKTIAKYVLDKGIGNRDGAVERWMSYTDKVYGTRFKTMSDGSCLLDVDEAYMRKLKGRYWGTENEFYGDKDFVIAEMGPVKNHPYIFLISSLRALQMRRNIISISDMTDITHVDYKTQEFLKYLALTTGKQLEDTPDAFVLMGERYIAPYRLTDQMDVSCVNQAKDKVTVRSFGRWLSESPQNTRFANNPAIKVRMPASENHWYQGFYLPQGIDYEYFAREGKIFSFDVNDQLSQKRCSNGCEIEIKATFKDTDKTRLQVQVAEGVSQMIETNGDNSIKTATFTLSSTFKNQIQESDFILNSIDGPISLILMRANFLN